MPRPSGARAGPYTPTRGRYADITFPSKRQYENRLAQDKGYRSVDEQRRQTQTVRNADEFARLRPVEQLARSRALDAISLMRRDNVSLSRAARLAGTTVNAVRRHAGRVLEQADSGRYRAKPYDRMVREMRFLTREGVMVLSIRDSRSASKIARHMGAVDHYLKTGDDSRLRRLRGKGVWTNKRFYPFLTDLDALDRLANAGEVSFEELYARAA